MDTHYVCEGGCGGTSDDPKACQTESCSKNGEMMAECHCADGEHAEVLDKSDD